MSNRISVETGKAVSDRDGSASRYLSIMDDYDSAFLIDDNIPDETEPIFNWLMANAYSVFDHSVIGLIDSAIENDKGISFNGDWVPPELIQDWFRVYNLMCNQEGDE